MKAFVTGASGFIAKHVLAKLLATGHSVTGSLRDAGRAGEVRAALEPHLPPGAMARLDFASLDLTRDAGWDGALAGHDVLIHTASPFPIAQPKDPEELIRPAVDGTRRALMAAKAAGITRVVLTSSTVAILSEANRGRVATEADWVDPDRPGVTPYQKSKVLAERLAWEIAAAEGLALTTINPAFVLGPPMDRNYGSSVGLVRRIMRGRDPMMPRISAPIVDVRDVAEMHLRAAEDASLAGERFLATAGTLWFTEMAQALKAEFPDRRMPTRTAPSLVVRLLALFDKETREAVPILGKWIAASGAKAEQRMGMRFIPPAEAVVAAGRALVEMGEV